MASEDDDIAASLPKSPPPAPAMRDAAIQEAMRRFDAGTEPPRAAPVRPEPRRIASVWSSIHRPQLGVLVAASLVAVIGLPLAWLTVTQQTTPAAELASQEAADMKTFDVEESALPAMASKPPAIAYEPRLAAPPPTIAANDSEGRADETNSPPAQIVAPGKVEASTALAAREIKRADRFADAGNRADVIQAPVVAAPALPAAAPPPTIAQEASAVARPREASDLAEVVVTARRRGRAVPDRGDWNICTINDPKQSLAACKSLINPGAKGIKGQAATHLADGLSSAWAGNIDRAIAAFDQAIAINPKSSLAYLNRGLAWQQKGNGDRALADLDQAVKLTPNAARGYYNRSLVRREQGDDRRAKADQARAVDLDTDYEAVVD